MSSSRCIKRAQVFQVNGLCAQVIEEAHALPQQYMDNSHMKLVEQACLQGLLDRSCPMQGHIFLACEFLCFGHRTVDAVGDEVKLRVGLFLGCSRLRLQDNHRPGESRAVRHDPPLLTVNLIKGLVPHNHCASPTQRIAHDFMELLHGPAHPGEDQRGVTMCVSDKAIEGYRKAKDDFSHVLLL